jgi:undecaprenyl-diphosphatase
MMDPGEPFLLASTWERIRHLDLYVFHLINDYAGNHQILDELVVLIHSNDLLKGMLVWMVWWGLWFLNKNPLSPWRAKLLATAIISLIAIFAGRILSLMLPFRLRPIHDPEIEASLPIDADPLVLEGWSSLPSDHAVFFFALATSIFLIHRRIGILVFLHAIFIIALPRIYAGLHFPSDIVIGALVGVVIPILFMTPVSQMIIKSRVMILEEQYPYFFYPVLFLVSVQSATIFGASRAMVSTAYSLVQQMVN